MDDARTVSTDRAVALSVKRVGAALGAEVTGIDLRQTPDAATADAIGRALGEHEVLFFPDQKIDEAQLMAFGRCFGELSVHPFSPNEIEQPEVIKFENREGNPPGATDVWHSDETFRAAPPMGTMLIAREVPEVGGDTMYVSMTAAYEGLSDRMKHHIDGLVAIHDFKPFKFLFPNTADGIRQRQHYERLYPPAEHPVVTVHPVSGKRVLFVNPQFTIAIKGMEERESRALLESLFQQALTPEFQYRHHWRPGLLAFWDNRSTQHYAVHDYYPQRRIMDRVTIAGVPPQGIVANDLSDAMQHKLGMRPGSCEPDGDGPKRAFVREIDKL